MSGSTYNKIRTKVSKPLVWLRVGVKTPPFSVEARCEAGLLLRDLQEGLKLEMPDSRPMPSIGKSCHELRIKDNESRLFWRIIYRIDADAIVIAYVFAKKTGKTPINVINECKRRYAQYDSIG